MKKYLNLFFTILLSFTFVYSCGASNYKHTGKSKSNKTNVSWYGADFHGRKTANGERYNMNKLTAAHKTLPFGTKVKITNIENGKSVIVTINDRGPFVSGRDFDLSKAAFQKIAPLNKGVLRITYKVL